MTNAMSLIFFILYDILFHSTATRTKTRPPVVLCSTGADEWNAAAVAARGMPLNKKATISFSLFARVNGTGGGHNEISPVRTKADPGP